MPGHYTVGLVAKGKADRVAVVAEDALIAALRVKAERPDATITYVRRQNRRGDARHPSTRLPQGARMLVDGPSFCFWLSREGKRTNCE